MTSEFLIRPMNQQDIGALLDTFAVWHKTQEQYEGYLEQQERQARAVLLAWIGETVAGYVTLVWRPEYAFFRDNDVPEIVDLNVMSRFQKQGIGTALIHAAEALARQHGKLLIGISVEQSVDYAAPNRLYPQLGYVPDGRGISQPDNELHLLKRL